MLNEAFDIINMTGSFHILERKQHSLAPTNVCYQSRFSATVSGHSKTTKRGRHARSKNQKSCCIHMEGRLKIFEKMKHSNLRSINTTYLKQAIQKERSQDEDAKAIIVDGSQPPPPPPNVGTPKTFATPPRKPKTDYVSNEKK